MGDMKFYNPLKHKVKRESVKEVPEKTPIVKNIDWSDFKTAADKEWESFVK